MEKVYVFNGAEGRFPSAVFSEKEMADKWIVKNKLTGVLTTYPLNTGVFEWAVEKGYFKPKGDEHLTSGFIGRFTSASMEHYHYENGEEQ